MRLENSCQPGWYIAFEYCEQAVILCGQSKVVRTVQCQIFCGPPRLVQQRLEKKMFKNSIQARKQLILKDKKHSVQLEEKKIRFPTPVEQYQNMRSFRAHRMQINRRLKPRKLVIFNPCLKSRLDMCRRKVLLSLT